MENLDLIVSPTKLFDGTTVPRTSDQKMKNASFLQGEDKENSISQLDANEARPGHKYSSISIKTKVSRVSKASKKSSDDNLGKRASPGVSYNENA